MKCRNCGTEIADGQKFCPECGASVMHDSTKTIQLKCKSCDAIMTVDDNQSVITCPYCGSKELIPESDAVKSERIRTQAYEKIENKKMERADRYEAERKEEEFIKKKGKGLIVFAAIFLIVAIFCFSAKYILPAFIAVIQTGLFGFAWAVGMNYVKPVKRGLRVPIAVLGFVLIIPWIMALSHSSDMKKTAVEYTWPTTGLATLVNQPDSKYGEIDFDSDISFMVHIYRYSAKQYDEYVENCKSRGFTVDANTIGKNYYASDKVGNSLDLTYSESDETMVISIYAFHEETEKTEDMDKEEDNFIADASETNDAEIEDASEDNTEVVETEKEPEASNDDISSSDLVDGMRPEFKKAMDEYEEFYNQYCDFLIKYNDNPSDLKLITEYAKLSKQIIDMDEAFAKWDDTEMNAKETKYYIDVEARCSKKLIDTTSKLSMPE